MLCPISKRGSVPTIKHFGGFKITMYFEDHNPPHFHVVSRQQAVVVEIATLAVIAGDMARSKLDKALAWAAENKQLLMEKWNAYHDT